MVDDLGPPSLAPAVSILKLVDNRDGSKTVRHIDRETAMNGAKVNGSSYDDSDDLRV